MKNILITGANGQLGTELKILTANCKNKNFIYTDIQQLDITKPSELEKIYKNKKFDIIINCAAYTAVDKAENEPQKANLINNIAVKHLADFTLKHNIPIIHISTDYVFDGLNYKPYSETDPTNPINIYGQTKLYGEKHLYNHPKAIIIRTSWLYSSYGKNFIKTIINLSKTKKQLSIVADQIGTPTYAEDLAKTILQIIKNIQTNDNFPSGIYHYSNLGVASWYDFALYILKYYKSNTYVKPIPSSQYPTPAKRPHYSVLNKQKIIETFNLKIPHWQESIEKCLFLLKN